MATDEDEHSEGLKKGHYIDDRAASTEVIDSRGLLKGTASSPASFGSGRGLSFYAATLDDDGIEVIANTFPCPIFPSPFGYPGCRQGRSSRARQPGSVWPLPPPPRLETITPSSTMADDRSCRRSTPRRLLFCSYSREAWWSCPCRSCSNVKDDWFPHGDEVGAPNLHNRHGRAGLYELAKGEPEDAPGQLPSYAGKV